jgi:DNA (cytosine-5)-methyltransferase 1
MAGYRELLAVEWDDHAAEVFRLNFPDVSLDHGDIALTDPARLSLEPGELDVIDASPPCQGFSTTGLRQVDDPRNQMFRQFTRLLSAWQPRVFIMENVSGMVKGTMKTLFAEILTDLKTTPPGYRVTARSVDAAYLGVPQRRQRIIFVGVRADLNTDPVHPVPATRPVTVREAWTGLDDPGLTGTPRGKAATLAPLIAPGRNGADALQRRGGKPTFFNCVRLHWDKPANTILRHMRTSGGCELHPDENRWVGIRELSRLQSFPDEFAWGDGTYQQIHARIGNSVPPLMMRAIAETVRHGILDRLFCFSGRRPLPSHRARLPTEWLSANVCHKYGECRCHQRYSRRT